MGEKLLNATNGILIVLLPIDIHMSRTLDKRIDSLQAERGAAMDRYRTELHALYLELSAEQADHIRQRMKDLKGAP